MRVSIIVAGHNEGEKLWRTIQSCLAAATGFSYEIIVADDMSDDGSIEEVMKRFPRVHLVRHADAKLRLGPSPTKDAGARAAHGDVLIFLDGHCNPERGALRRMVDDVDASDGEAIITPAVPNLDVTHWRNLGGQVGHGYSMDIQQFGCRWIRLCDMKETRRGRRLFYESPALIGCALAISRQLYETLWGFDPHMFNYGVEDLDLGLKCWLMGHPILHDPQAVVGHRFRKGFDNYNVAMTQVLVNQLRSARKNLTDSIWNQWLDGARVRHCAAQPPRLSDRHEGLWAQAWLLFNDHRPSAEEERAYLLGRRKHDEFWFAEKFGLDWPLLTADKPSPKLAQLQQQPSPSPSPSPEPPPDCDVYAVDADVDPVCVGTQVIFSADHTGPDAPKWSAPGASPAQGGPSGTFMTAWSAPGEKTVTATCKKGSANGQVTVVGVKVLAADGDPTKVCVEHMIEITAIPDPGGSEFPSGSPVWVYTKLPDDSQIQNPSDGENPVAVSPDVPGVYTLEASCGDSKKSITFKGVGCRCKDGELTPSIQVESVKFAEVYDRLYDYQTKEKYWQGWNPSYSGKSGKALYNMNLNLTFSAGKLSITPALPDGCQCAASVRVLVGGNVIAQADGVTISGSEVTLPDITAETPLGGSVHKDVLVFDWEISFDGGFNWCEIGSTDPITIYWVAGAPTIPADKQVYDLALEKACAYVGGDTAYTSKINLGIAAELDYRPDRMPPGGMIDDSGGILALYNDRGGVCVANAYLLQYLQKSIGAVAGSVIILWGGTLATRLTICDE